MMQYGDEIGMGDDLTMEERECARTPMQWTNEPRGGFSRAERTVRPVIDDEIYGYEKVNVAQQRRDPESLLNWTERRIRMRKECPGDLVGVDTDANGLEGYVIDVSRTFLCGDVATPEQKEAYRVAYDCVQGMLDLVRPGIGFEDFARKAPRLPDAYIPQCYPTMAHQAGLEDEGPGIPYADDDRGPRRIMPKRELKENMVLCLECYAGKVGAPFGVKLEEQVLVTADGARSIGAYPYDDKLLA
jgi:Xaa-Pro aminopeptidase